jgi:hypothetical protein
MNKKAARHNGEPDQREPRGGCLTARAKENWTMSSVRNDWKRIFPFD